MMKIFCGKFAVGIAVLALSGVTLASPTRAQNAAPSRAGVRTAADVLNRIGQAAGLTVLADVTVAAENAALPAVATTPENFEQQIADLVKTLPQGTTWVKLYLPAPQNGRWNAEDVASYVAAQAKLFGTVGAATPGTVEILGQRVPAGQATEMVTALKLKPVYLVTNPARRAEAASSQGPAGNVAQWGQMTPEQQQTFANQQAQQLLNMDPALRQQVFQQQRAVMRAMFRQMGPEQRRQMFQGFGGGRRGGRGGQGGGN